MTFLFLNILKHAFNCLLCLHYYAVIIILVKFTLRIHLKVRLNQNNSDPLDLLYVRHVLNNGKFRTFGFFFLKLGAFAEDGSCLLGIVTSSSMFLNLLAILA